MEREEAQRTPCSHHVKVEYRSYGTVERTSQLEGFDPEVECEHQQEDGDGFVVVGPRDGTRNISGSNANEGRREETRALVLHLLGEPMQR